MSTIPFNPLLDINREYQQPQHVVPRNINNTPIIAEMSAKQSKQPPLNRDIIPDDLITLEKDLETAGSTTSTLSHVLAWLGAAKGDFRMLAGIEDEKRKTALGKAIIPHIKKYNQMVTEGKIDEASAYMDRISSSFSERAPSLAPYLTQMATKLTARQEGLAKAQALYNFLDPITPQSHVSRPVVDAIGTLVKNKDFVSEGILSNLLNRTLNPHVQQIGQGLTSFNPATGRTETIPIQAFTPETANRDFVGYALSSRHNLSGPQDLTNLVNGITVKDTAGNTITPTSEKGKQILRENSALQEARGQFDALQKFGFEPTQVLQIVKTSPAFSLLRQMMGGDAAITTSLNEHYQRLEEQAKAPIRAQIQESPTTITQMGKIPVHGDVTDLSTLFTPLGRAVTVDEVNKSAGDILLVDPTVLREKIEPAMEKIQGLDLIPQMLTGGNTPTTGVDRVSSGVIQMASRLFQFPLDSKVEIREAAKQILRKSIEQVENMLGSRPTDRDSREIATLKSYAAGDFRTDRELIAAAERVRLRLAQVVKRNSGINIPLAGTQQEVLQQKTQPGAVRSRQRTQQRSQPSTSPLNSEEQRRLNEAVLPTVRQGVRQGQQQGGSPGAQVVPIQPAPKSAEERVNDAVQRRSLQRAQ